MAIESHQLQRLAVQKKAVRGKFGSPETKLARNLIGAGGCRKFDGNLIENRIVDIPQSKTGQVIKPQQRRCAVERSRYGNYSATLSIFKRRNDNAFKWEVLRIVKPAANRCRLGRFKHIACLDLHLGNRD